VALQISARLSFFLHPTFLLQLTSGSPCPFSALLFPVERSFLLIRPEMALYLFLDWSFFFGSVLLEDLGVVMKFWRFGFFFFVCCVLVCFGSVLFVLFFFDR